MKSFSVKSFPIAALFALVLLGALFAFGCVEQNGGNGEPTISPLPSAEPSWVACTADAKLCPGGSYVGRVAPDCEFAPCPSVTPSPSPSLIGGQRDEHGCLGPAGYSWCEAKQKCLRVWEENCSDECSSDNDCVSGGCSGELCGAKGEDLISTCIWREEFACYGKTTCGCVNGECAWKSNAAFDACLNGS